MRILAEVLGSTDRCIDGCTDECASGSNNGSCEDSIDATIDVRKDATIDRSGNLPHFMFRGLEWHQYTMQVLTAPTNLVQPYSVNNITICTGHPWNKALVKHNV